MFKMEIDVSNEAFCRDDVILKNYATSREIFDIMSNVCSEMNVGKTDGACFDRNGNKVGTWSLEE